MILFYPTILANYVRASIILLLIAKCFSLLLESEISKDMNSPPVFLHIGNMFTSQIFGKKGSSFN